MYSVQIAQSRGVYVNYGAIVPWYTTLICEKCDANGQTYVIDPNTGMIWNSAYQAGQFVGNPVSGYYLLIRTASYSAVVAGNYHSLAIDATTGMIWAWGTNTNGSIGDNSITTRTSPVSIARLGSYSALSAYYDFTLAIDAATGNVWSWGYGGNGNLGNNSTASKSSPVAIIRTASYSKISAGYNASFAIDAATGMIWAWGYNGSGRLGNNSTTSKSSPVSIARLGSYTQVSAGNSHVLAIDAATGNIYAWGANDSNKLGTGDALSRSSPVTILRTDSFIAVAAGKSHSFAIDYLGQGWGWGSTDFLCVGYNTNTIPIPMPIIRTSSYAYASVGNDDIAVIEASTGNIYTMGSGNTYRTAASSTFVQILRTASYSIVEASKATNTFFAIEATTGNIWAWGRSPYGTTYLGDNTIIAKSSPVQIARTASYSQVSPGGYPRDDEAVGPYEAILAIDASTGNIWGWGYNGSGITGTGISTTVSGLAKETVRPTSYSMLSTGRGNPQNSVPTHTLAIDKATGNIYAWGSNSFGQLGLDNVTGTFTPTCIKRTASYSAVAAGNYYSLAIDAITGNVWAWGFGGYGNLGNNATTDASSPVAIVRTASYTAIAAGVFVSFAIDASDGMVYAWGGDYNSFGLLGIGDLSSKSSPVAIARVGSYSTVVSGPTATYAIDATTGMLWVWGNNFYGQLGIGTFGSGSNKSSPVAVSRVSSYSKISAGNYHLLALDAYTGNVFACGYSANYKLGVDLPLANKSTLTAILRTASYSQVCAGAESSFAIEAATGNLYIWGSSMTLEYGTSATVSSPILLNSVSYKNIQVHTSIFAIEGATDRVFAWGGIGDGMTLGYSIGPYSSPVACARTASYSKVSVGSGHSLAIDAVDGMIYSWGDNGGGQLGDNTVNAHLIPKPICRTSSYSQVCAGSIKYSTSYAIDAYTGMIYAWGYGAYGKLGDGAADEYGYGLNKSSPVAIARIGSYSEIAAMSSSCQAIDATTGMVYAWGRLFSQAGLHTNNLSPIPILRSGSYSHISTKKGRTFGSESEMSIDDSIAIEASTGMIFAWGSNQNLYSTGIYTATVTSPIAIVITDVLSQITSKEDNITFTPSGFEAFGDFFSDLRAASPVHFNGHFYHASSWSWSFGDGSTSTATNPDHTYATENDFIVSLVTVGPHGSPYTYTQSIGIYTPFELSTLDQLYRAGDNANYRLGDGTVATRSSMVSISSTKFTYVSTNAFYTLALDDYNNLWAWGTNAYGQFGNNSVTTLSTPTIVRSGPILLSGIASCNNFNAILDSSGMIYTCGNGGFGQLGNNAASNQSSPVAIVRTASYSKIAMYSNSSYMMAIDASDGMVYTWGWGAYGNLGNGTTANKSSPVAIARTASYSQIAACSLGAFAIDASTGMIYSWGGNYYGCLGINDVTYNTFASPIPIARTASYSKIATGIYSCFAIDASDGSVWGWGQNTPLNYAPIPIYSPTLIASGSFVEIRENCVMVDSSGFVWAFGNVNSTGNFGTRDTIARSTPSIIAKIV